jgi:hypothetical protein
LFAHAHAHTQALEVREVGLPQLIDSYCPIPELICRPGDEFWVSHSSSRLSAIMFLRCRSSDACSVTTFFSSHVYGEERYSDPWKSPEPCHPQTTHRNTGFFFSKVLFVGGSANVLDRLDCAGLACLRFLSLLRALRKTTMSSKSSLMQYHYFVPWALTSDSIIVAIVT